MFENFISRIFGKKTQTTTPDVVVAPAAVKPVVQPPTVIYTSLKLPLTNADFKNAADRLSVDIAILKALATVESGSSAFSGDGRAVIRFESHHFHRLTKGKFVDAKDKYNSPISTVSWVKSLGNVNQTRQWDRFNTAAALDRSAAIQSTSFGMFQVMGFNFSMCGYKTPEDFFNDVNGSTAGQLNSFVGFLSGSGIVPALRRLDFREIALRYNGRKYEENNYHIKIEQAYKRFKENVS